MTAWKNRLIWKCCIGAGCVAVLAGCEKKREQSSSATDSEHRREVVLSGARIESPAYVANRIADVRCQREATCMDIGPGHRFENRDACVAELRKDGLDHLAKSNCTHGTDPRALQQCLDAIQAEVCPRVLEQLDHLTQCQGASICYSTD